MYSRRSTAGMTIIEVMIAAMILFIAALGLMMVVTFSARQDMVNSKQSTALAAGNQKLEELRDTDWDTLYSTYSGSVAAGGIRYPTSSTEFLPGLELEQGEIRIYVFFNENDTSDAADLAGLSVLRDDQTRRSPSVTFLPPGSVSGLPAATTAMVASPGPNAQTDINGDVSPCQSASSRTDMGRRSPGSVSNPYFWADSVAAGTIGPPEFLSSPYSPNMDYPAFVPVMITVTWKGILNKTADANDRSQIVLRARLGRRRY